jgi:hypothetical protein
MCVLGFGAEGILVLTAMPITHNSKRVNAEEGRSYQVPGTRGASLQSKVRDKTTAIASKRRN